MKRESVLVNMCFSSIGNMNLLDDLLLWYPVTKRFWHLALIFSIWGMFCSKDEIWVWRAILASRTKWKLLALIPPSIFWGTLKETKNKSFWKYFLVACIRYFCSRVTQLKDKTDFTDMIDMFLSGLYTGYFVQGWYPLGTLHMIFLFLR